MGSKLIRIHQKDIAEKAKAFTGVEFSIVLSDKSVFHGVLRSHSGTSLIFVNSRKDKFEFRIDQIDELISTQ